MAYTYTTTLITFAGMATTSAVEPDTSTMVEAYAGAAVKRDSQPLLIKMLQLVQAEAEAAARCNDG